MAKGMKIVRNIVKMTEPTDDGLRMPIPLASLKIKKPKKKKKWSIILFPFIHTILIDRFLLLLSLLSLFLINCLTSLDKSNFSMQTHKVLLRQLAVDHQGNGEEYEYFKKMIEASPLLYKHDFHVYNDGITTRHHRNIAELSYIQSLIKNRTITPQMLSTNIYNAFYPSYVLANHYSVFLRMLIKLRDRSEITQILKAASQNQITGAFFHETRSIDIKDNTKKYPRLDDKGIINM